VSNKEVPDTTLVLQRRIVVKILVPGPSDLPQFLVARRARKQRSRLVEPSVLILGARDEEKRLCHARNGVDRAKVRRIDPDPRCDQLNERRRRGNCGKGRTCPAWGRRAECRASRRRAMP